MNNNNNVHYIDIADYVNNYCQPKDLRKLFYFIGKTLKDKHISGEALGRYDVSSFLINPSDFSDVKIDNTVLVDKDLIDTNKKIDLLYLGLIAFNSYLPDIEVTSHLMNYEVVKSNFDSFAYIFNEQDRNYYRELLVNGTPSYYSDYVEKLNKDGNNLSNGRVLTYSTPEGKILADNELGYSSFLLFVINLAVICLIAGLLFTYLS